MLRLRAVAENDDWNAYHTFRKQQRHVRLYGSPLPNQVAMEVQALESVPLPEAQLANPVRQATLAHNPVNSDRRQSYYKLLLAA